MLTVCTELYQRVAANNVPVALRTMSLSSESMIRNVSSDDTPLLMAYCDGKPVSQFSRMASFAGLETNATCLYSTLLVDRLILIRTFQSVLELFLLRRGFWDRTLLSAANGPLSGCSSEELDDEERTMRNALIAQQKRRVVTEIDRYRRRRNEDSSDSD